MSETGKTGTAVPWDALSPEALNGVIEAFVLREGTEYGEREFALGEKVAAVRRQLERGHGCTELAAVDIVFLEPFPQPYRRGGPNIPVRFLSRSLYARGTGFRRTRLGTDIQLLANSQRTNQSDRSLCGPCGYIPVRIYGQPGKGSSHPSL